MNPRILIIDDEEGIRFTFKRFLKAENYDVHTAADFEEAVQHITDHDFDVIFADIILSGKTGIDVLREIKSRNLTCPVIMITGFPNIETASEAIRLGAFDYIPKPIQKDALLHAIDVALQHKEVIDEREKFRSNLEAIFRSVKDAIISVDKDLNILEANSAAAHICGLDRDTIGGRFSGIANHCGRQCVESLARTIETKESVELSNLQCGLNGNKKQTVSLSTFPLLNRHDDFAGAIMVIRDETRLSDLERELGERQHYHRLVGHSKEMQDVYSLIDLLTDVETTVLITGESGTGKELVAEALHYKGNRSDNPMVKVNCSALTESLLESELFGHVRGAFTGAIKDKVGRFQMADGGTIFLDEIADISAKIQVELLRVLQEKEFERVGDSKTMKVDVRVIAATNQDLSEKVREGKFREDLYYRLNVMKINLPSLRQKREDIPLLTEHFISKFNKKFGKDITSVSRAVEQLFMNYDWPGNVRELEHTIEHAFILCRHKTIAPEHLPPEMKAPAHVKVGPEPEIDLDLDDPEVILDALRRASWNKTKAAELLGISRRSIYRKIKELDIPTEQS